MIYATNNKIEGKNILQKNASEGQDLGLIES